MSADVRKDFLRASHLEDLHKRGKCPGDGTHVARTSDIACPCGVPVPSVVTPRESIRIGASYEMRIQERKNAERSEY